MRVLLLRVQYLSGSVWAATGTGWSNSFDAFSHVSLRMSSAGKWPIWRCEQLVGVGPGAVLVRVVGLEQHVVDADEVALLETGRIVDRAEPEVALHDLAGRELDALPRAVDRLVAGHVVEPVEQAGDPAEPAFGQADLQVGEAHRDLRVEPVDRREHRPAEEQHADRVGRRVRRGGGRGRRRPDVQADHRAGLLAGRHERVPPAGVQRRQAEALGELGEGHGLEATRRVAPDLRGGQLRVEQPRHLARDDATGVGAGPLLEVPVVRGADDGRARGPGRSRRAGSAAPRTRGATTGS